MVTAGRRLSLPQSSDLPAIPRTRLVYPERVQPHGGGAEPDRVRRQDLGESRTEVTYDLTVELKIKIPGLLRRKVQGGIVDAALKDLKRHVEASPALGAGAYPEKFSDLEKNVES